MCSFLSVFIFEVEYGGQVFCLIRFARWSVRAFWSDEVVKRVVQKHGFTLLRFRRYCYYNTQTGVEAETSVHPTVAADIFTSKTRSFYDTIPPFKIEAFVEFLNDIYTKKCHKKHGEEKKSRRSWKTLQSKYCSLFLLQKFFVNSSYFHRMIAVAKFWSDSPEQVSAIQSNSTWQSLWSLFIVWRSHLLEWNYLLL